jgi:hypothetical protein
MLVICRIFSPEEDCEVIESEKHSHVFYQAETDIWMVLVMAFHYFNNLRSKKGKESPGIIHPTHLALTI